MSNIIPHLCLLSSSQSSSLPLLGLFQGLYLLHSLVSLSLPFLSYFLSHSLPPITSTFYFPDPPPPLSFSLSPFLPLMYFLLPPSVLPSFSQFSPSLNLLILLPPSSISQPQHLYPFTPSSSLAPFLSLASFLPSFSSPRYARTVFATIHTIPTAVDVVYQPKLSTALYTS